MSVVGQEFENMVSEVDLRNLYAQHRGEFEEFLVLAVQRVIGRTPPIEHFSRKVVKEQFDLVLENLINSIKCNFLNQATTSKSRELQLKFLNKISLPVFTGKKIKGEDGTYIKVALVDCLTGQVVNSGPESTARFEVVSLEGYAGADRGDDYNSQDFGSKIVAGNRGTRVLLKTKGLTCLSLKEGIGYIDELSFVHNSTWLKNCELCLGARSVDNFPGVTIRAAKTESFTIKDRRTSLYAKRKTPFLDDEVWRLKNINRKDGVFFKHLTGEKIETVKDFLRLLYTNPQKLQEILRVGDNAKAWKDITDHARTCVIDKELYLYSGVVFDIVGQVKGLREESGYFTTVLSENQKTDAQKLVKSAFDDWEDVLPYGVENSLVEEDSSHSAEAPRPESPNGHNQGDPGLLGIYEHNCIEKSSSWHASPSLRDDPIDELRSVPKQVSDHPIYTPEYIFFDDFEYLRSNKSNPQPESSNVDLQPKRRWIVVLFVLKWFRILRRRTRFPEEDHVHKKQRTL